jgi:hypothetical protein
MIIFLYGYHPAENKNAGFAPCDEKKIKNRRVSCACGWMIKGTN